MPQRRSRRIAGQEPSLVDEESAREVYDQFVALGYSEEKAHDLVYKDGQDLGYFESLRLFVQLRTKGFDDELALALVNSGKASLAMRIYDNFMPLFHNDGQASAKFASLYLEMAGDELEMNDASLFNALQSAQRLIMDGTTELEQYELSSESEELHVGIAAYDTNLSVETLLPHQVLLAAWAKFATAMSSITKRGCITLCIQHMELSKEVFDLLLESVQASPLQRIVLVRNNLFENDYGVDFVVDVLKANSSINCMGIMNNLLESEDDAHSLTDALINHPKLDTIVLDRCGLGRNESIMKSIVPLLGSLDQIQLAGNQIDSLGVKLISDCLAMNPSVNTLSLIDNLLNDEDAAILANSLMSNTNLRILRIAGNSITQEGMKSFHLAVRNTSSFNAISDSNHTCCISDGDEELSKVNIWIDPKFNETDKLFSVLRHQSNMHILNNIPIELMPRVLYLLQGRGFEFVDRNLNPLFWFIRQWCMPLLFTSCVGLEPRRSERVRKRKVADYMYDYD